MKNVNKYQLKKCIFLTLDEYEVILKKLFGNNVKMDFDSYGTYLWCEKEIAQEEIYRKIAKYFDVKQVTSTHIDDCDVVGVWIVYK